jgi:hypothetical protein
MQMPIFTPMEVVRIRPIQHLERALCPRQNGSATPFDLMIFTMEVWLYLDSTQTIAIMMANYFSKVQKTIPALLIGAGYNILQSRNFFFPIMISYNVLHPFTPADQRAYSLYRTGLVVQLGFINIF